MPNNEILGMSPGLKTFVAACFAAGAVFTGANGLPAVSVFAVAAAVASGFAAVAEVTRRQSMSALVSGIAAGTLTVLASVFVLVSPAAIPLAAVAVVAAVPVMGWIGFWMAGRRSAGCAPSRSQDPWRVQAERRGG